MKLLEMLGILSFLGGILLGLFQGISSMMTTGKIVWKGSTLISVFGENAFTWIDDIGFSLLANLAGSIVNMQLALLLIGLGGFFFIIAMVFKRM